MTKTNSESVLKTAEGKNFIVFVVINDSTSEMQTARYVFQQSVLPLLYNVICTSILLNVQGSIPA